MVLVACGGAHVTSHDVQAPDPVEGALVGVGGLDRSGVQVTFDVLIPAGGDIPGGLAAAKADVVAQELSGYATVTLGNLEENGLTAGFPGYAVAAVDDDQVDLALESVGVVRITARGPPGTGWDLMRRSMFVAAKLAADQGGWIYDPYRAQLHDADTLTTFLPDRKHPDVRSVMRCMAVVSESGIGHVRTIGLWFLGEPELIVADVPNEYLDAAIDVARAAAQTVIQNGGVTRPGVIEVDHAKMPPGWLPPGTGTGTGRITLQARWKRGQIHHNAMEIVLSVPGGLVPALRAYAGIK